MSIDLLCANAAHGLPLRGYVYPPGSSLHVYHRAVRREVQTVCPTPCSDKVLCPVPVLTKKSACGPTKALLGLLVALLQGGHLTRVGHHIVKLNAGVCRRCNATGFFRAQSSRGRATFFARRDLIWHTIML